MVENYENSNVNEQIGKNIDNLDRNINDLDNKVKDREDFTKYFQEFQDIQNKFKSLDSDISSIVDEVTRKNLKDRMDNLKIMMLDLVSDGSIDNFIKGETKDAAVNKMVGQVDEIFYKEMENLGKSFSLGDGKIGEMLSDTKPITESMLVETAQFLGMPYGKFLVTGDDREGHEYLGFINPQTGEIYALVDGKLKTCEGVSEDQLGGNIGMSQTPQQQKSGLSFSHSTKQDSSVLSGQAETVKANLSSINTGPISVTPFILGDVKGYGDKFTPNIGVDAKGLNTKLGNVGLSSKLTASYSPGYIANGGWENKDVFKLKAGETIKFKNGISLSLYETFKTVDFSKIESSNLSTELGVGRKPNSSNISLSAIANFDNKGPTFIGVGGTRKIRKS